MKKRIITALLAALMLSTLTSCGKKCEECGEKATEEIDGTPYCEECIIEGVASVALDALDF